jgi:hypothetical protein
MAEPVIPVKGKLFIGIIAGDDKLIYKTEEKLVKKFGPIDERSPMIPFKHTDYYRKMGQNLSRVFFSFKKLIHREDIIEIKLATNKLEKTLSPRNERIVNIDPGYITLSNVFLASCKEYFHRAYLSRGIYLENEYKYIERRYRPWEWTYPDYQQKEYLDFFHLMRQIYYNQIQRYL